MISRTFRIPLLIFGVLALLLATAAPVAAHGTGADPDDGKAKSGLTLEDIEAMPTSDLEAMGSAECANGMAAIFPCQNVDLAAFVPLEELGGVNGSDIWGWEDPLTGREYAIMTTGEGTAFVDVTQPSAPVVVGILPTNEVDRRLLWRDVKVYADHAFVVSENRPHGMQVFDLTRLRNVLIPPAVFTADTVYEGFGNAHNVAVNPDTGYAYAVGTNTCNGGLHMVNIQDPTNPTFAGCAGEDGYVHDVECVIYQGRDGRFRGDEICFGSNEDTVTIYDVTDKANPVVLSKTSYPTSGYTHQGWLTPDHRWFLFGDELDEFFGNVGNTTTYIMQVTKLDQPAQVVPFTHSTRTIDHNLYIHGSHVYEANYVEGLQILSYDRKSLGEGRLSREAFFDVVPGVDEAVFGGAWSSYKFDSGTTVVSAIESGLFVLLPDLSGGEASADGQLIASGSTQGPMAG
ncbi:MAG: choice-of-anchor B family protein [Actinomycetota bacterium]|nr:choice-of-anchor B family protein [Actinomycetota bacterium]